MTRWSLFLQTLSLLHHFLGLYSRNVVQGFGDDKSFVLETLVKLRAVSLDVECRSGSHQYRDDRNGADGQYSGDAPSNSKP